MRIVTAALASVVMISGIAHADDDNALEPLTQPIIFGDAAMTCLQIVEEIAGMETRLGGDPSQSFMDGEQLAGIGTGFAQRTAISAGAGGAAVGAIGKVGGLLGKSSKKKKRKEAEQRAIAEKRWLYMAGLYQGRSCDAKLAAGEPAPETEAETTE